MKTYCEHPKNIVRGGQGERKTTLVHNVYFVMGKMAQNCSNLEFVITFF
jgi:hypothetical protein